MPETHREPACLRRSGQEFEVVFVDRRDLCGRGPDATEFRDSGESKWKHAAKPSSVMTAMIVYQAFRRKRAWSAEIATRQA